MLLKKQVPQLRSSLLSWSRQGIAKPNHGCEVFHQNRLRLCEQTRSLSIHEYQAQSLLREAGIPVPRGYVASTPDQVSQFSQRLGLPAVVKAQVHAGGRGKGTFLNGLQGGVHIVNSAEEASTISSRMLGHHIRTKQTSENGLLVQKVYLTEKISYEKEFYLSMALDRNNCCPAIVASRHGGMDIETAAKTDPTSVVKKSMNYLEDISFTDAIEISATLGLTTEAQQNKLFQLLTEMYRLFKKSDATLLEINPLVITASGDLICLDSKFSFDNAARYRQEDIFALEEKESRDLREAEAERLGFSYVKLDGTIGNMVNGAGLAMATMDAINFFGGSCANFLDAGGKATKQTMIDAFRIVLGDERVKVMFINIYGGIIHGDMMAEAIISAVEELGGLRVPLVIRLQGTDAEKGQAMLADSGLNIHSISDFSEAAQLAVKLASQ